MYKVVRLRTNGKRNPREESLKEEGVLGQILIDSDNRSGELVRYAKLFEKSNPAILGRIVWVLAHPEVVAMTNKGMLIRGIERSSQGSEMVQEWWCTNC